MAGVIAFAILGAWMFLVFLLSGKCVAKMAWSGKKYAYRILLFVLFFLAPVADEITGGFQFRALCSAKSMLIFDEQKIRGKTLVWSGETKTVITGTILPINEYRARWVDITTEETLLEQIEYGAMGGWLSRSIAFNSITKPYTFNGSCSQEEKIYRLSKELNFERKYR